MTDEVGAIWFDKRNNVGSIQSLPVCSKIMRVLTY